MSWLERTERLLGKESTTVLAKKRIAVFGIGGVGGYVAEALARSGVGTLDLIDSDVVAASNLNRQIIAAHSTVGRLKVEVMQERILDINPDAAVYAHSVFYLPQTAGMFDFSQYDYVADAIDTVSGKISIIEEASRAGTPVISAMGAGNKLDPTAFCVADIYETSVCPLAKVMRRELKKRGIGACKVVYSREQPRRPEDVSAAAGPAAASLADNGQNAGRFADNGQSIGCWADGGRGSTNSPGSCAFVPPVVGLIMAGEIVKDLTGVRR